ncbi:ABC transporter substrate-binding protein [Planomonospora parontospora]|uniref:ABC transporter substrate-binding protein n=1 Tax=Planomonospora parontospora TaxID=58119 RepID=UPI001670A107|nr:ABC transporter substrate-binding protein [Planomonospora parontospora]GGL44648.1 ABC transporter substrate-binding protein [Planomonospora parontospora subsp. antibiotica]GII19676.1 ABC transporter substrate-binding protein [Planomonospora parontospora subsp. antibiotica]
MRLSAIGRTAVTAGLLLAAAACGGREDTGAGAGATAAGACQGQQTTGITDTGIKLGGIYPLSGPASAYGAIPKGIKAYFDYVNAEKNGIGGRRVEFVVRDDGYQPPKAVEEARRLVEQEQVFALFQTLGTPSTTATWDYAGQRKVPQVFVATGASKWGTDTRHPWTIGWQPNYVSEARVYAQYLKQERPDAKVAVLYQNDDFGKDLLGGFEKAIEGSGVTVVAEQSYEVSDPSVDPQMRNLAQSGADVLLNVTTPRFGSQALAADARNTRWNPLHIVNNVAASITVLRPVGFENVQGVVSATYYKDPVDPQWKNDPEMTLYHAKLKQYAPDADPSVPYHAFGWAVASSFHKTMEAAKCPTREGLRDAMRNLSGVEVGMLLPGVTMSTGPGDGFPIESMRLMRFEGERWELFGEVIDTRKEFGPLTAD